MASWNMQITSTFCTTDKSLNQFCLKKNQILIEHAHKGGVEIRVVLVYGDTGTMRNL